MLLSLSPITRALGRAPRAQWGLWAALALALLTLVTANLVHQRARTLARETAHLATQARLVRDNLGAQLRATRQVLVSVPEQLQRRPGLDPATRAQDLQDLVQAMPGLRTLIVTDAQGRAVASNRVELVGQDFSQRHYFQAALAQPDAQTLYVSPPFRTVLGVYALNLTRARVTANGALAGVQTATLDPSYAHTLLASVRHAEDVRAELRHPHGELFVAEGRAVEPGERLEVWLDLASPELRMDQPLRIGLSRARDAALAEWRDMVALHGLATLLVLGLGAAGLGFHQRRQRVADAQILAGTRALHEAQRIAGLGSWHMDLASGQVGWSPQLYALAGLDPQQPAPDFATQIRLFTPESWARLSAAVARSRQDGTPYELELEMRRPDGSHVWMLARGEAVRDAGGTVRGLQGVALDITERKATEARLQLFASVFTHSREAIMITDAERRIVEVNEAFTRITGYSRDEVLGQNPRLLSSGRQGADFYATLWQRLEQAGHWSGEIWNQRKNGEPFAELITISRLLDAQGQVRNYLALFADITPIKHHQSELERIAHFDALTGLPNRTLLADRLRQAMLQAHRRGLKVALAFLDLDGFKGVNDRYGHEVGDALLIALGERLRQTLREGDTLARLGGDEFVAVLLDLAQPADGEHLVQRLVQAAAEPIEVEGHALQLSASVGVTYYPQAEEVDGDQLLRQADLAMYQAKLAGKNRYAQFDAEHDRSVRELHEGLADIQQALQREEFVLHYQPKVNLRSGELIGLEALIRWQHPVRGLLLPGQFLPLIESHVVQVQIGEWVIEQALRQLEHWRAEGLELAVSVNIAGQHLLQLDVAERLAAHPRVRPAQLELEVLESSALGDLAHVARVIESCRKLGVSFAIDDFGTGYSSLSYLKRLDAQRIKIDQSFVRDMLDDPDDLAILEGVLGLARAFQRQAIAEGVETEAHGEALLSLGCEYGQGYGIARPMPAEAVADWLACWHPPARWQQARPLQGPARARLYAVVEHRAWMAELQAALSDRSLAPPPLDLHECGFGRWLDGRLAAEPGRDFSGVQVAHQALHARAAVLLDLQRAGALSAEQQAGCPELLRLSAELIRQVEGLDSAAAYRPG
ncbi:EAL domain-containing protein [Inhella sp.]|uniref:EAL domain-containing protein n=1 Tax=Inhella sp. TaxID=1921806 RepID=UPI0035B393AC